MGELIELSYRRFPRLILDTLYQGRILASCGAAQAGCGNACVGSPKARRRKNAVQSAS
jgi:hypothetical protein